MALTPETDEEWFAVQGLLGRLRKGESASPDGYAPTAALVEQVAWWSRALRQMNKAIKRNNKYINRLEAENAELRSQLADVNELHVKLLNGERA